MRARPMSATSSVSTSGVLVIGMLRRLQASRSVASTPTPKVATISSFGIASII